MKQALKGFIIKIQAEEVVQDEFEVLPRLITYLYLEGTEGLKQEEKAWKSSVKEPSMDPKKESTDQLCRLEAKYFWIEFMRQNPFRNSSSEIMDSHLAKKC